MKQQFQVTRGSKYHVEDETARDLDGDATYMNKTQVNIVIYSYSAAFWALGSFGMREHTLAGSPQICVGS